MHFWRTLATFREQQYFGRGFLLSGYFCKTPVSSCFCVMCSLWISNTKPSSCSFKIYICLYLTIPNVIISWKRSIRLIMLHCPDIGTSLLRDNIASCFLIIFTSYMNKSYKNTFQYLCHVTNWKLYLRILNSAQTNCAKLWQILKEQTEYGWSTCARE